MRYLITGLSAAAILAATLGLIPLSWEISKWEARNGFPYGKMCNSIFTLYEDTCK